MKKFRFKATRKLLSVILVFTFVFSVLPGNFTVFSESTDEVVTGDTKELKIDDNWGVEYYGKNIMGGTDDDPIYFFNNAISKIRYCSKDEAEITSVDFGLKGKTNNYMLNDNDNVKIENVSASDSLSTSDEADKEESHSVEVIVANFDDFKLDKQADWTSDKIFEIKINFSGVSSITKTFVLDKASPEIRDRDIEATCEKSVSVDEKKYTNDAVKFTFSVSDSSNVEVGIGDEDLKPNTEGKYTYAVNDNNEYNITAEDAFGRVTQKTIKTSSYGFVIDSEAPSFKNLKFNGEDADTHAWTNKNVEVTFDIVDNISGVENVTVNNAKLNPVSTDGGKNSYSFTAEEENKEYIVHYTDKVGNDGSVSIESSQVKMDKTEPTASDINVLFSNVTNKKFGLYSNDDIELTVTVNSKGLSPIESIELYNNGESLSKDKVKDSEENQYYAKFILNPDDKAYKLSLVVKDAAGNESKNIPITNVNAITINGEDDNLLDKLEDKYASIYEIVSTKAAPNIEIDDPSGSNKGTDGDKKFKGQVTFASTIDDSLAGIATNGVKHYFGKEGDIAVDGNDVSISKELSEISGDIDLHSDDTTKYEKIKTKYTTDDNLENGTYYYVVEATNNCGNTNTVAKEIVVDNKAPVIKSVEFKNESGNDFMVKNNNIFTNGDVVVTVCAEDEEPSCGINDIVMYNGSEEISGDISDDKNSKTFKLDNSDKPYQLSFKAVDELGNETDEISLSEIKNVTVANNEIISGVDKVYINSTDSIKFDDNSVKLYDEFNFLSDTIVKDTIIVAGESGKVQFNVSEENCGISEVVTKISGGGYEDKKETISDYKEEHKVTFDLNGIESGDYTITCNVTNNCGITSKKEYKFTVDNTAPVIKNIQLNNKEEIEWTNEKVVLTFEVTDDVEGMKTSGINLVTVKDSSEKEVIPIKNDGNKYEVTLDKRDKYTINASDMAGNNSSIVIDCDKVKIDMTPVAPGDITVSFKPSACNIFNFGLFSDDSITMEVKVADGELSPITKVNVYDNHKLYKTSETKNDEGNFVFTLDKKDKDDDAGYKLSFIVTDEAGNVSENIRLADIKEISVNQNDLTIEETLKDYFEVLPRNIAPYIEIANPSSYENNQYNEGAKIYTGTVTFKATVTDSIAGIDVSELSKIKCYFGKNKVTEISKIKYDFDENEVTKNCKFEYTIEKNTNKVTKAEIEYTTQDKLNGSYSFSVCAKNNCGKESNNSLTVTLDNTAPVINNIDFTGDEEIIISELDGEKYIFTKSDLSATVEVSDAVPSVGIDSESISLSDENEKEIKIDGTDENKRTFIIKPSNEAYILSANAKDKFGLKAETVSLSKKSNAKITINGKEINDVIAGVIVNADESNISDNSFIYEEFAQCHDEKIYTKDGKITLKVEDNVSGIKDVSAKITDADGNEVKIGDNYINIDNKSANISFPTNEVYVGGIPSGKYTIVCNVENNCGVSKSFEDTFYIDKTAPEVVGVEFSSVTNTKKHGIYTNNDLEMTVVVKNDNEVKGSNTPLDTIVVKNGEEEVLFTAESGAFDKDDGDQLYRAVFTIPAVEGKDYIYNLSFETSDIFENNSSKAITNESLAVKVSEDSIENKDLKRVVCSLSKPTIDDIGIIKDSDKFIDESSVYGGNIKYSTTVTDDISGLDHIEYYFAKSNKVKKQGGQYINLDEIAPVGTIKNISDNNEYVNEKKISYDTVDSKDIEDGLLESGEYLFIVKATNLAGNTFVQSVECQIDNTAPQVTDVYFSSSDKAETMNKTYGIYSNEDVTVKVYAVDESPSSGISDILLSNDNKEITANEDKVVFDAEKGKYYKTFTLKPSDSKYASLSVLAIDSFGNRNREYTSLYEENEIATYNTKGDEFKVTNDSGFEVVIYKSEEPFEKTEPEFSAANNGTIKVENKEEKLFGGDNVTIKSGFKNALSYIKSMTVSAKGPSENEKLDIEFTVKPNNTESVTKGVTKEGDRCFNISYKQKIEEDNFTIKIPTEKSGMYTVTYSLTDNCGNNQEYSDVFYVDNTAPKVEGFKFNTSTSEDAAVKILNFLTFGIYSNDDIDVVVTVSDQFPSSGIDGEKITLATDSGGKITNGKAKDVVVDETNNSGKYERTFTLKKGKNKDNSFFNGLYAKVTDEFGNKEPEATTANKGNIQNGSILDKKFEIVASGNVPKISGIKITGSKRYDNNKGEWYSLEPDSTFKFTVTEKITGIHSIKVMLNGEDVTKFCSDDTYSYSSPEGTKYPAMYNTFDSPDSDDTKYAYEGKIEEKDISLNLYNVYRDSPETLRTTSISDGENTIKIIAVANNGLKYEAEKNKFDKVFYVDDEAPQIIKFELRDKTAYDALRSADKAQDENKANVTTGNVGGLEFTVDNPTDVVKKNYGYFFKDKSYITVTATDFDTGVGVETITFNRESIDPNKKLPVSTSKVDANNQATFEVPANFKGNIFASATDYVDNEGKNFYPNRTIVENEKRHSSTSKVTVKAASITNSKDVDGRPLYDSNVYVDISVKDSYSGIKKVEYHIIANGIESKDQYYQLNVPHNFKSEKSTSGTKYKGWYIDTVDNNIVTEMSKTITVDNNSNNIEVKVIMTDNSGFTTEKSLWFSIDKTAPKIKVTYSPANPEAGTGSDAKYYKHRKATITVTERNFDPKDFVETISNKHGSTPRLVPGNNWNSYSVAKNTTTESQDAITHTATIDYVNDGDYVFSATVRDKANNKVTRSNNPDDKFTIDKTNPVISVSYSPSDSEAFSRSGGATYFGVERTATVKINEHNFDKSKVRFDFAERNSTDSGTGIKPSVDWHSDTGDTHTAVIRFAQDGNYLITVNYSDKALNKAKEYKGSRFYIDKAAEQPVIDNVTKNTAYGDKVMPIVRFSDPNFNPDTATVTLRRLDVKGRGSKNNAATLIPVPSTSSTGATYTFADFPHTEENDGIYELCAEFTDRSGNRKSDKTQFSVNRFGSTFMPANEEIEGKISSKYHKDEFDLIVSEINVTPVSKHKVTISRNGEIINLSAGKGYSVTADGNNSKWYEYKYTIDKSNFEKEGNYIVTISSVDNKVIDSSEKNIYRKLSNRTAEERGCKLEFVIDKTAPLITISGIDSDTAYEVASKTVKIVCEDANIAKGKIQLLRNGKVIPKSDYSVNYLTGEIDITLVLNAEKADTPESITIKVTDLAGRTGEVKVTDFILSASLLTRFLANTTLVVVSCVVLALIIGAIIFLIIRKRKKSELV